MNIDNKDNNIHTVYNSNYINEAASFEERVKQPLSYRFKWMLEQLNKDQRPKDKLNILDAGCGKGFFVHILKEAGFNVVGVDNFSETGNDKARHFHKKALQYCHTADLNNLVSIRDDSCDYVTCSEVIEHMEEPEKAIKELYRVLKPNGQLFITTPIGRNLYDADHKQFFNYIDIHKLFKDILGEDSTFVILKKNKFFEHLKPNLWAIKIMKGMKGKSVFEEPNYLHEYLMRYINSNNKVYIHGKSSQILYLDIIDKGCEVKVNDSLNNWSDVTICIIPMNKSNNINTDISIMLARTKKDGKLFFFFNEGENLLDKNPISSRMDFYTVADYIDNISSNVKIIRMNRTIEERDWNIFLVKIEGEKDGQ
jgi:2-polyprenyl-3-methyl-5-hydroxy-6-metoxy-1,4-benzoquinol methylase